LSITSLLTSRYPCQILWTDLHGRDYPHKDESVRFPELLSRQGVATVNIQGLIGLGMRFGISRGFTEEVIVPGSHGRFANSVRMMPALLQRLSRVGSGPMFAYLHFEDPHAPYDSVTKVGPPFQRYLAEVGQVDSELGLLLAFIREHHLEQRVVIVVTADHGESFREHGKSYHSTNLYSEAVDVPLVFHGPGLAPRRVSELVSLVDLAPTFLDLFGVPTPGTFMGQSLVPLLAGSKKELPRPVIAQTMRGIDAMFFRDGYKVVLNHRGGTVELYDSTRDPHERDNLSDELGHDAKKRAELLEAFLNANALK
jgi:arylsulfatase A-like enzyme